MNFDIPFGGLTQRQSSGLLSRKLRVRIPRPPPLFLKTIQNSQDPIFMKTKIDLVREINKGRIAVFIDVANLELSAKDKGWRVDYERLYSLQKNIGQLIYCGFFTACFNTPSHNAFLTFIKKTGFRLVTKPLKIIKKRDGSGHLRKANFDVEIAVETMKRINDFDTFILFSGDSDFHYLLKELKTKGKTTMVISMKHHVAKELVEIADFYIDLSKIKDSIERKVGQ